MKENKIVFYSVLILTCMGFLACLGGFVSQTWNVAVLATILTTMGLIIIGRFNKIFPNEIQKNGDVK